MHSLLENDRRRQGSISSNDLNDIVEDKKGDKVTTDDHEAATHSRLLTKGQLSDMALGVRELSKKLGSVRLKLKVKTVFLLTKAHDENLIWYTRGVAEWLLSKERETSYVVYMFS